MVAVRTGTIDAFYPTTGTANITVSSITVPADATMVVVQLQGLDTATPTKLATGALTFTKGSTATAMHTTSSDGCSLNNCWGVATYWLELPDTGSGKTLDMTFSSTVEYGPIVKIAYFKDCDTSSSAVRSSGGGQDTSLPWTTATLTCVTGDRIFGIAGNLNSASEGTFDTWTNATTDSQFTAGGPGNLDCGWCTGTPTGNVAVSLTAVTGINGDGGLSVIVIKPASAGSPYTLTADQASFTLTGQAAGLTVGPWEVVGVGTSVEVTGTAHTLTVPAGVQQGDLLVAVISSRIASTTSITLPTGGEWTTCAEQKTNNILSTGSAVASGLMAYCYRGASNPNLTFTHPVAPSVALGRIVAYRGSYVGGWLDQSTSATTAVSTTSVNVAGVTTTFPNDLIVVGLCGGQEAAWSAVDATNPSVASGATNTTTRPTANTWIERAEQVTTTSVDTSLAIADGVRATAGATGNITATATIAAAHVVLVGAFRPRVVSLAPYTLTADSGSFAVNGQTAGLKYGRVLTAAQGAFALTGQTAVLRFGHKLIAGQGAFALTGQTATLRRSRLPLVAGQGSFNVNGQDATLTKSTAVTHYTMPADAGMFALSGQTAVLRAVRKLTAAQGAFVLTGQTATLRRSRLPLVAAQGSFLLTGQTAVLRAIRKLTAAQGAFALTGQAVVLAVKLPAAQASFAVNGQTVTLRYGHKLIAASGSFLLTGQTATLKRTRVMPAAQASFALSGPAVNLIWSGAGEFTLPAGIGFFNLTGQTATLRYSRKGVSAQGAFALTGQTALLKRSRVTPAATGMFAFTGQSANLIYTQVSPGDYVLTANRGTFTLTGQLVELTRTTITPPAVLEAQPGRLTFGRRVSVRRW